MVNNKTFPYWQKTPIIPPLLVNNNLISNFREKAIIFNDFFVQQCQPIPNYSILSTNQNRIFHTQNRLRNFDNDRGKIVKLIKRLNPHKAHGYDGISIRMVKLCNLTITKPLPIIYKTCLQQGVFPDDWKKGLLYKLKSNGIDGNLLKLITSFLNKISQQVVLNGQSSVWKSVKAGVPQGSVLGPLFFFIYINDTLLGLTTNVKLFADDASLFSVVNNAIVSASGLNNGLVKIRDWAFN